MSLGSLSTPEAVAHVAQRFPALVNKARDYSRTASNSCAIRGAA
jgi:hypothetical protein